MQCVSIVMLSILHSTVERNDTIWREGLCQLRNLIEDLCCQNVRLLQSTVLREILDITIDISCRNTWNRLPRYTCSQTFWRPTIAFSSEWFTQFTDEGSHRPPKCLTYSYKMSLPSHSGLYRTIDIWSHSHEPYPCTPVSLLLLVCLPLDLVSFRCWWPLALLRWLLLSMDSCS